MWFNDNIKYNRRTGVPLQLYPTGTLKEFAFDSKVDAENTFNSIADNFYAPMAHLDSVEADYPDPLVVPMWPKFDLLEEKYKNDTIARMKRLWHTTEIHTYFEYSKTEIFDFSGDDDVWVFINGRLAVDLGGVHSSSNQFVDLARDAAAKRFNLTVGETYTFDMFQAERKFSQSNFKLTTTLTAPCNAANELNSKKQFDSSTDLIPEMVKTSRSVTIGPSGSFLLTRRGDPDSSSYLWVKEPVNLGTGFVIDFDFTVTNATEGFALVLQRRPEGLSNLPISGGANLGFKGLKNSLAIVFDLCHDREATGSDCTKQQVSIHAPESGKGNNPSVRTLKVRDSVVLPFADGAKHHVKVDYFFIPPAVEVTIDGSLYLRVLPVNIKEIFQSQAAYAGFTAASNGAAEADVVISDFTVYAVDVESSTTLTVDFPDDVVNHTRKYVLADGAESDGYTIQTRDGCKGQVNFGGRIANTEGIYVERVNPATGLYHNGSLTPKQIAAVVEDDGSGKYKYAIKTEEEGLYSLYVYYGNPGMSCGFSFSTSTSTVDGNIIEALTVTSAGVPRCFFASVEDAIEMVPLTLSPTMSPSTLPPVDLEGDATASLVGAVGGSVLAFCVCVVAAMVIIYKRKWEREKGYIDSGRDYGLDAKTTYDKSDKFGVTGRQLLASRAAIIRQRAQRGIDKSQLTALENEQEELLEQVAKMKKVLYNRVEIPGETIQSSRRRERLEF